LVSPLLATAAAGLLYPLVHAARERLGVARDTCLCIGERADPVDVGPDGTLLLRRSGLPLSLGEPEQCRELYRGHWLGISVQTLVDRLHLGSAFALGFARGLNDTPKVLALLVAAGWSGIDPRLSLAGVAAAMAVGGWLRARKVAETLAHRITSLSHGQGLLANAVASTLVIGASLFGSPVSTTHVSSGALFGIGAWSARTDGSVVGGILLAWLGTLPLAAVLAAATALSLGA
jgi:PiT family inorganic phosphate transporter